MIHVNARSLLRHFDDLAPLVTTERLHIIAISETWLDSSVSNNKIHLAGFNLFRIDRNRSVGGVAVYCSDHLPCSLLYCGTSSSGVKSLWVSVRVPSLFSRFSAKFSRSMFIRIKLSQHLHTHNLLYPLQSGFCPSHSTQTLLLHCLDKWYKALDTKKYVRAVFLDISKAFGTASHELLSKLANLGLSPSATSWF